VLAGRTRSSWGFPGRSICLVLPERSESTAEATRAIPAPRKANVLLIDDEPILLRGLKRSLSAHRVVAVTRVAQALDAYSKQDFDIVFCDLMMPEATGVDFYQHLCELGPGHAERLVLMTGGVLPERLGLTLSQIPTPCLLKPFSNEQLEQLIGLAVERRR
jgi:CheY-like chemotaxis protein